MLFASAENAAIVLAANRLPLSLQRGGGGFELGTSPGGLVSAITGAGLRMHWIGWPGAEVEEGFRPQVRRQLAIRCENFQLHPLFLTEAERKGYYEGFSNQVIWPCFHGLPGLARFVAADWSAYRAVNCRFAGAVVSSMEQIAGVRPGREILVWLHDYQLLLVPGFLRGLLSARLDLPPVRLGFFLHIPFPEAGDLRPLPAAVRFALLRGLLATDLLGFQAPEYLESFHALVRASPLLGGHERPGGVASPAGFTRTAAFPIGIAPERFRDACRTPEAKAAEEALRARYAGFRLVLGVDRLDPAKGLLEKLWGFSRFLADNPDFRDRSCLHQIVVPSRVEIPEYARLRSELLSLVEQINRRFPRRGAPAVNLVFDSYDLPGLVAHYRSAEALLVTSLKDGMNLVSFEYAVCRQGALVDDGVVVLSRSAGAARYLKGCLLHDPRDHREIAAAIGTALRMDAAEKNRRSRQNLQYINRETSRTWVTRFLGALRAGGERAGAGERPAVGM